jgi:HD-GYP domain-containing protein (c-di-GMP phosphodiesterase class II)
MLEIISTHDLKLGMFVAELDRPWLGTPFALQGFLISNERQLAALREYCSFVSVDRSRSVFTEFRGSAAAPRKAAATSGRGVIDILRSISVTSRATGAAPVRGIARTLSAETDGRRSHEPEMAVAAAPVPEPTSPPHASPRLGRTEHVPAIRNPRSSRTDAGAFAELLDVVAQPQQTRQKIARHSVYVDRSSVEEEILASDELFGRTQELVRDMSVEMTKDTVPNPERIRDAVDAMVQSMVRNPDALIWLSKLKRTDNYSYDHALDVSVHLIAFGRHLGFPLDQLNILGIAGLLQDVGKIRIPLELLQKIGPLAPGERAVLRRHVEYSAQILRAQPGMSAQVLDIVAKHHERIDASGYPRRLRSEDIGIFSEMAGLVDSYCALSYDRPYRPGQDNQRVLRKFYQARGKRFSEPLVIEFIQCVGLYPVGTLVELNSGEVAVVVEQNRIRRLKPRVLVLLRRDKSVDSSPHTIDLKDDPLVEGETAYRILNAVPPGAFGIDAREFYL